MNYSSRAKIGFVSFAVVQLLGPGGLSTANAAEGGAESAGNRYLECGRPNLRVEAPIKNDGGAGFGIELDGEPYFFTIQERVRFAVKSAKDSLPVADVLVDQPSAELFAEQSDWRKRYMENVADRAGVKLERQELGSGLEVMTANKSELKGQFIGISLIIDPVRKVMVQWNWAGGHRYSSVNDVQALQSSIWSSLGSCLKKK